MAHKQTLAMTVATRRDFEILVRLVFVLMLLAGLISSHPLILLTFNTCFLLAALQIPSMVFANTPLENCTVHVTRDGQLSFTPSHSRPDTGELKGSQWCTRHMAILRYRSGNAVRHLVLIAARQSPESFRQLSVWLRHNNSKQGRDQS